MLTPAAGAAGAAGDAGLGTSCPKGFPATPATAPPTRAVVAPSIFRRLMGPNGVLVDSSLILPLIL